MQKLARMYSLEPRGDIDDPLEMLAEFPASVIEQALKILSWLEVIGWRWDINTLLKQPADLLDAVLTMKAIGESIMEQARKKE